MDDHIAWLVDRDCFKEALTEAEKHESFLRINSVLVSIGNIAVFSSLWEGNCQLRSGFSDQMQSSLYG